ncbi:hypothetical protein GCM10015535_38270 [Streptomyces gelaticus]|uniref:Uncharacterized protein n=1 Tax=Streptomyces gelaticus TaxID=285446 RepID=A0ABQ2W3I2_9ACTN|nr:hypothetical protein GCM10015535_38270 [Streptomyces gelaticus]
MRRWEKSSPRRETAPVAQSEAGPDDLPERSAVLDSPAVGEFVHQSQPASGSVRGGGLAGLGALAAAVVHFHAYDFLFDVELDQEAVPGGGAVDQGVGGELGDAEPDVLDAAQQAPAGQGFGGECPCLADPIRAGPRRTAGSSWSSRSS